MKKVALFAFNGDPLCFAHVLLNALDLQEKDYEVEIVIEGPATHLIKVFDEEPDQPFAPLYNHARNVGLIGCACEACSKKTGAYDHAIRQGIALRGEMKGHPSMASYLEKGYKIITF